MSNYDEDDYGDAPVSRRGRQDDDAGRGRVPPHAIQAEEALLGAMLLSNVAIGKASEMVAAGDFYKPTHGTIFQSIMNLYEHGDPVDPVTVADDLSRLGMLDFIGGPATLINLQSSTPATSSAGRYAQTVSDMSVLRKVIAVSIDATNAAYDPDVDVAALIETTQEGYAEAISGLMGEEPSDLWILDEFLDRPLEDRPPWVIPGMLRKGWRAMAVAAEGVGKTVLFRQIGIAAAQGIHPLSFGEIPPVRVLIVDLENPEDSIHDVCTPLRVQSEAVSTNYDSERAYLWHKPGGINLRNRRDRMELETVIAKVRPDLVCLGPIYKCYNVAGNESDEQAAKEVMQCFDDLRTRYDFALLLEHHAPKGAGKSRDLLPYGSSLWLRWPELGLKLTPTDTEGHVLKVGRWRGDRLENSWPDELHRGKPWLWQGKWPDGTFTEPNAPRSSIIADPRFAAPAMIPAGIDPETGEILVDGPQGVVGGSQGDGADDWYDPPF